MKGNRNPRQSGQILVLMALLSTTMIILFGMVVGIGHIVQAKINLQNAVDLAAMSGASWQARFLNHVGLINYRMRQNYKFAVYDIYVTNSRFNVGLRDAVRNNVGTFARIPATGPLTFGICQQAYGWVPKPGAGVSGSGVDPGTDLCQLVADGGRDIPPIVPSLVVTLNPALIAANAAIIILEQERKNLCAQSTTQNAEYFRYAMGKLQERQEFQIDQMIALLKEFDNAFGTDDGVGSGGIADATMLATFNSNLIGASRGAARLEYLNPSGTRAFRDSTGPDAIAQTIKSSAVPTGGFANYFERQRVRFSTRVVSFGSSCTTRVVELQAPTPTLLGLSRARTGGGRGDVKIPFNIVLKATVQPRILFWPRQLTPTLVAVGAAKPFGSRIGPPTILSNYEVSGKRLPGENPLASLANMSFYPGDVDDASGRLPGIGHTSVLRLLLSALPGRGGSNGSVDFRPSVSNPAGPLNCNPAGGGAIPYLCLSLAPSLYEGLFWNVYPFPAAKYAGSDASILAEFPFDFTTRNPVIKTADANKYGLPDRMDVLNLAPNELAKWHETVLIGESPAFRDQGKPAFFADQISVASSWSPDVKPDALGTIRDNKGRRGYQIKLTSLAEICREIELGAAASNEMQRLRPYCEDDELKVNH